MKGARLVNRTRARTAGERCVYGIHAVLGWLRSQPGQLRVVHYDAHAGSRLAALLDVAAHAGIVCQTSSTETLAAMAGGARHQGVVAVAAAFQYADLDQVLRGAPRLLVAADQMQDPHNLGALVRTAAAAGAAAVIIPKDGSVGITATVEASAAGAAAMVPVCRVTNLARTLQTLKANGCWCIGLVPQGGVDLYQFAPPEHVAVVVGGEAGMRPLVSRQCDFAVSIPMYGKTESLNASVAAAVAAFELRRRWSLGSAGPKGSAGLDRADPVV
jgi:23S rRNA (guanosine2251-2'-O)-methyltransferase